MPVLKSETVRANIEQFALKGSGRLHELESQYPGGGLLPLFSALRRMSRRVFVLRAPCPKLLEEQTPRIR